MKLTSGKITVPIERDGVMTGEIAFDPDDVVFAERFYDMMEGLAERERVFSAPEGETATGLRLKKLSEICGWLREQVNLIFGGGSSDILFGEHCSLEMFRQFFEGIEPFIRKARSKKTGKYLKADVGVME